MNIKSEIKGLITDITGLSDAEKAKVKDSLNIELMLLFIENIGNAEKEIFKFLADLSGKTVKELENQKLGETVEMIKSIFTDEEISDFLKVALK